jgi:hypothetical protein
VKVYVARDRLHIGERLSISFQRTLRIPDDGRVYPLPPGLGPLPVRRVSDYADRVPPSWVESGGVFIPLYQREALWLGFEAAEWKPNAVKVAVGGVNAVSGETGDEGLTLRPQNYLVCPQQPWLDGINAGEGYVRQFVAAPLGEGSTVEAQVTGAESTGGMRITVYEPRPGVYPDSPPPFDRDGMEALVLRESAGPELGVAAGGMMRQKIYPDTPEGFAAWDPDSGCDVFVHLLNSEQYRAITGSAPPPSPISARSYTELGLPWFQLYDESMGDVAAPDTLRRVKSHRQMEAERGDASPGADPSLEIPDSQVRDASGEEPPA